MKFSAKSVHKIIAEGFRPLEPKSVDPDPKLVELMRLVKAPG
ncbi:MAG: hypothetical protein ETSY2_14065 [Candidatus Entotheonella gemina]|uniref:Uncharacterized protein n=1 Tax=Candidatus Entotheonella gemina TaxID=1429439 RepID=W4M9S2_9BACT|nr:MAG: hypothetical protein ETSY2_14065 [Candidatus Entotheonella gemina]